MITTTSPLGANKTFTGDWQAAAYWDAAIVGAVFADQAGTLHIEQGFDGKTADVDTAIDFAAGEGEGFEEPRVGSYWRLRFVNGSVAQNEFRLNGDTRGGGR